MADHTTERERAEQAGAPTAGETEDAAVDESRAQRAANLFDLRRLIGGLFVIYGVILTVLGFGASDQEIQKAAGINLNLWVGLCLIGFGALFLLWAFARPLSDQLEEDEESSDEGADAAAPPESETTSGRTGGDRVGAAGDGRFRRE
jgi:hypothetical protein